MNTEIEKLANQMISVLAGDYSKCDSVCALFKRETVNEMAREEGLTRVLFLSQLVDILNSKLDPKGYKARWRMGGESGLDYEIVFESEEEVRKNEYFQNDSYFKKVASLFLSKHYKELTEHRNIEVINNDKYEAFPCWLYIFDEEALKKDCKVLSWRIEEWLDNFAKNICDHIDSFKEGVRLCVAKPSDNHPSVFFVEKQNIDKLNRVGKTVEF